MWRRKPERALIGNHNLKMATSTTRKRKKTQYKTTQSINDYTEQSKQDYTVTPEHYRSAQCQIYSTLGGAFLFSCLCTSLIWFVFLRERGIEYTSVHAVKVLSLSNPRDSFATQALEKEEPLIIKNSIVTQWPARKLWSPKYLQSKLAKLNGIYENSNRWFGPYYDTSKPLSSYTRRINSYRTDVSLTGKEFFERLQNPAPGRFHYLTSDIDHLGEWAIYDVYPLDELLSPNPSHSSINVWIGQPNVIAHCHYDGYHNFYVQLYGRKKFTLFSPTQWPGLYPYPFLHPSHAQSQVNLSHPADAKEFPLSGHLEAYEVTLDPGDVLYIPPLWFHHVESLTTSISVNVWTHSQQSVAMETIHVLDVPFTQVRWHGEHLKAIGGSMLIYRAIERVCHARKCPLTDKFNNGTNFKSGSQYFVYRLWRGRYAKLMEKGILHSRFISKRKGEPRTSLLCEQDSLPSLFFQGITQKLYETPVEQYLTQLSQLVEMLPSNTWELWFGNYIEHLVSQAVDLLDVGLFLKHYDSCSGYF